MKTAKIVMHLNLENLPDNTPKIQAVEAVLDVLFAQHIELPVVFYDEHAVKHEAKLSWTDCKVEREEY